MSAWYNEIDPYAAQWLRNLIDAGQIARGDVDERSIVDVRADDLAGYDQCHFFAGIGGWSIALRLAGWPDDRPVWTGSCPCQPFSAAGQGKAADDERHLWPAWASLIAQCRPAIVFGEQVEAAIGWGWLDAVFTDLEAEGYACGAAVLPACSVGAPHIRQRLWFVADADAGGRPFERRGGLFDGERAAQRDDVDGRGADGELADAGSGRGQRRDATVASGNRTQDGLPRRDGNAGLVGDADLARLEGRRDESGERAGERAAGEASPWRDLEWLPCTDGKARPTQPGLFPLAHGVHARAFKLRAYGNAIVPQVAAEFIRAVT